MPTFNDIPESLSDEDTQIVQDILDAHGFSGLTQTQVEALENDLLEPWNSLLVAETGNGKTLCAEAVTLKTLRNGGDIAYLVPSYQLTQSKTEELRDWADTYDYKVQQGSGYGYADVSVVTFESFFRSIINNTAATDVDRVVLDDFHEIYSKSRGPGIEQAIAAIKDADIRIMGMSATLGNPDEIADWLDSNLIVSSERRGVPIEEIPVEASDEKRSEQLWGLMQEHDDKGPFLIFNSSRRNAESRAADIAEANSRSVDRDFENEIEKRLTTSLTGKYEKLAELMESGVAFHHSGLESGVRDLITEAIHDRDIHTCLCTPGLAYGFDAPIQCVIVADLKLWKGAGMEYIGVWEYNQWVGRAGRTGYGYDKGYAIPIWNDMDAFDVFQFNTPVEEKELERVETHIEDSATMRWLVLELVDKGWTKPDELEAFMQQTLLWEQMEDPDDVWGMEVPGRQEKLENTLSETVQWLQQYGFLEQQTASSAFKPTAKGSAAVEFNYSTWVDVSLTQVNELIAELDSGPLDPVLFMEHVGKVMEYGFDIGEEVTDNDDMVESMAKWGLDTSETTGHTAAILAWSWCQGVPADTMERDLGIDASYVATTARNFSKLFEGVKHLYGAIPDRQEPKWIDTLVTQLDRGIATEDVYLVRNVDGFAREKAASLESQADRSGFTDELDSDASLLRKLKLLYDKRVAGGGGDKDLFLKFVTDTYGIGDTLGDRLYNVASSWDGEVHVEVPPLIDKTVIVEQSESSPSGQQNAGTGGENADITSW